MAHRKFGTWLRIIAFMLAVFPSLPVARSEEAPSAAEVEKLQSQLVDMRKEMDAMRKELASKDIPSERRDAMMGHMHGMQRHWQMMHEQCCMMDPSTCPHTKTK